VLASSRAPSSIALMVELRMMKEVRWAKTPANP
jgi:hypothetical protein